MKIDILGYWGGYPWNGGATAGYLISTPEGQFLLDCGSGIMSKLSLQTRVENLSGVILSHLHYDHMADVGILQYALTGALRTGKVTDQLPIFAPDHPVNLWQQIQSNVTNLNSINQTSIVYLAGSKIEFLAVKHTIPCYAVKITYKDKVFVYSADTEYFEGLIDFAKDADLFICEATICQGSNHTVGVGHMDSRQAALLAKKANVKKLVLTHLPHDGDFQYMKQQACAVFGSEVLLASEQSTYFLRHEKEIRLDEHV